MMVRRADIDSRKMIVVPIITRFWKNDASMADATTLTWSASLTSAAAIWPPRVRCMTFKSRRKQVVVQLRAQVLHHAFLHLDRAVVREIRRQVLDERGGDEEQHQAFLRHSLRHALGERAEHPVDGAFQRRVAGGEAACRPEQRLQQRNEQHHGGRIEQRRDEPQRHAATEQAGMWPDQADETRPRAPGRQPRLGVSSAIGSTTSSGDTPPCRNAPR